MRLSGRRAELGVGVALLVFCGLVYWETTTFPEVPAMLSQNVPPTFFPRLVLGAIVLLTILLLVRGDRREKESVSGSLEPRRAFAPIVATAASITAVVAVVPRLGTFATIAVASIGLPLLWGERRALLIGLLALGLPLSIYLVFVMALGMRFPKGLLP